MTDAIRHVLGLMCFAVAGLVVGLLCYIGSGGDGAAADVGRLLAGFSTLAIAVWFAYLGRLLTRVESGSSARH